MRFWRHFSFGYDQPHTTGCGVAGDIFSDKLAALSHNTMAMDEFPGAQLGKEPQMLRQPVGFTLVAPQSHTISRYGAIYVSLKP